METKFNKSEIMTRAWRMFRHYGNLSFSHCLECSWSIQKRNLAQTEKVSRATINRLMNSFTIINRSRLSDQYKPLMAGTQEHFKLLNSKHGKKIMKSSQESETKEMLSTGQLVLSDIIHQRRLESKHFVQIKKQKNTFRNRIVNIDKCEVINIEEFLKENCYE